VSIDEKVKLQYNILCNRTFNSVGISVDFSKNVEAANKINTWIETFTSGKIKYMISSESLAQGTKMIIANAIYFKDNWKYQFDPTLTTSKDFTTPGGKSVTANFMSIKTTLNFGILAIKSTRNIVVELPYKSSTDNVSMFFIMPMDQSSTDISETESKLDSTNLTEIVKSLRPMEIIVEIPKFKIGYEILLQSELKKMGISRIFSKDTAELTKMLANTQQLLYVDDVKHKAFIEIDEAGTEAAAATVVMTRSATLSFTFNHPFMFIIAKNGAIPLFMGHVNDPTSEK
jgi:serpin B